MNEEKRLVRSYEMKIVERTPEGKRDVHISQPFKTGADDEGLQAFVDATIKRLNEALDVQAKSGGSQRRKVFNFIVIDPSGDKSIPIPLFGSGEDTAGSMRNQAFQVIDAHIQQNIYLVYQCVLGYLESKEWDFSRVTDEQWREACAACHPFFYSGDWSEARRGKFERLSYESIRVGLKRGTYQIKKSKKQTSGVLSASRRDKTPLVLNRPKKTSKRPLTKSTRVLPNRNQPKAGKARRRKAA